MIHGDEDEPNYDGPASQRVDPWENDSPWDKDDPTASPQTMREYFFSNEPTTFEHLRTVFPKPPMNTQKIQEYSTEINELRKEIERLTSGGIATIRFCQRGCNAEPMISSKFTQQLKSHACDLMAQRIATLEAALREEVS
jgi:hypothetical protein